MPPWPLPDRGLTRASTNPLIAVSNLFGIRFPLPPVYRTSMLGLALGFVALACLNLDEETKFDSCLAFHLLRAPIATPKQLQIQQ